MSREHPLIQAARRACEVARHPQTGSPARQVVAVFVFADGSHAVASYGATKAECAAIRPTCDAIADAIEEDGDLASFCPECGPNVPTDEDGCCGACGATATGTAVSAMNHRKIRLPGSYAAVAVRPSIRYEWRATPHGTQLWDRARECWVVWYGIGAIARGMDKLIARLLNAEPERDWLLSDTERARLETKP